MTAVTVIRLDHGLAIRTSPGELWTRSQLWTTRPATAVRQRTLSCTLSTAAVKAWSRSTASGSVP
ncbi:Uncharacterised protein [Mycobacteroides abscessus subsp. abscessus]|nr:Uncharacterised protein [Mycobacteroides abscessus subsp. abscessus]